MKNLKKYLKKFDLIYRNYYSGKSLVLNDQLSEAIEVFCEELSSNYDLSVEKKFLSLIGKLKLPTSNSNCSSVKILTILI